MKRILTRFARRLGGQRGATATEYAIMLVLILLVVIATVALLGIQVDQSFRKFNTEFVKAQS